ncbi:ERV-BabFcenv provirus ancestral Env polyprotein-like isoform X1 [Dipodomys merriami]|uniref:ERV-BabFcenv provirus ancestral Env polyprotein-like isoform X1 n=1 Tax=Dipodomys merriami TaxID=94247 RepID=UPI0038556797
MNVLRSLLICFCLCILSAGWKDNSMVRIAQSLASSMQAVDCWICVPRARAVVDHSDPLVHPVTNFTQVPDGVWTPTLDLRARTIMYRVRIVHYPVEGSSPVPCLTLPLIPANAIYITHIDDNGKETRIPKYFEMISPPKSGQLPMCIQKNTRFSAEEFKVVADYSFQNHPWIERTGFRVGEYFHTRDPLKYFKDEMVFCAPSGFVFVCQISGHPWATNCLRNFSTPTQCLLGTLITPFSIHSVNESSHWASPLKLLTRVTRDLPREVPEVPGTRWYNFGHSFLPWWGVAAHQWVLQNLSQTLITIANETALSLSDLHHSLDSLAKVLLDNRMALDYMQAEQGGVCAVANMSCCTYINTSSLVETSIEKIRQKATWLKQA